VENDLQLRGSYESLPPCNSSPQVVKSISLTHRFSDSKSVLPEYFYPENIFFRQSGKKKNAALNEVQKENKYEKPSSPHSNPQVVKTPTVQEQILRFEISTLRIYLP